MAVSLYEINTEIVLPINEIFIKVKALVKIGIVGSYLYAINYKY